MMDEASLRSTIEYRARQVEAHADAAGKALTAGNYSLAATECHRAYQQLLGVEAREFALDGGEI